MADQQKLTTHENAIGWIILAGVFAALFYLFWMFFEYQMKDGIRWIRLSEAKLVAMFVDDDYSVIIEGQPVPLKAGIEEIEQLPREALDGFIIGTVSRLALEPLRLAVAVIMGLMGFWALLFGPGTQYRRKMNLDGIIKAQSVNFETITPFVKFNPSTQPSRAPGTPVPAELPSFAEALGPEEWIAYNQIPVPDGNLEEDATYIALARQLGPRWEGAARLPPYNQILLAAFCLKASRKRKDSDAMLGRIAKCWSFEKGLDLSKDAKLLKEARAVLANKNLAGSTLAKCNQHSFHTTAMLRALQTAREEGGVLAPAQFTWLRGHDRNLWYPLNNLGRQAYHMEAMGAMAHFRAEKLAQRPIPKPKLDNAIKSISNYMSSPKARPIPQLDYSKSSKRGIKKPKTGVKKPTK